MRKVNLIAVFTPDESKLLFCHRRKDPYRGKYNLVGESWNRGRTGWKPPTGSSGRRRGLPGSRLPWPI